MNTKPTYLANVIT